jgi:hypothetical protein
VHSDPPASLLSSALPILHITSSWFRIHRCQYEPLYFGRTGENRFDAPGGEYGISAACLVQVTRTVPSSRRLETLAVMFSRRHMWPSGVSLESKRHGRWRWSTLPGRD